MTKYPTAGEPPTDRERREKMAKIGDFRGLLEEIRRTPALMLDRRQAFAQLQRALEAACRRNPRGFAGAVFEDLAAFSAYACLRLQLLCEAALGQGDGSADGRPGRLPVELTATLLPQLERAQKHLGELLESWAATERKWGLAERRRARALPYRRGAGLGGLPGDFTN